MIVNVKIKENPQVFSVAEVSIDNELPELLCRFQEHLDEDIEIKPYSLVLDRLRGHSIADYTFGTDRVLDAASMYFIIFDASIKYAGLAGKWREGDDKLCARIKDKCDNGTVVHELIHLGHNYLRKPDVSDDFDDNPQRDNLENAVEIATKLFLKCSPDLPLKIRDLQIAKVLHAMDKYSFRDYFCTLDCIDSNSHFYREMLNKGRFRGDEEFDFTGIFHNYYWEELKEVLLNGNFQPPKRQRFLFDN